MKAADGKGPIPHDRGLKSATPCTAFCCSEVGEEPQELEIVSHCPARIDDGRLAGVKGELGVLA